jgi:hypothetical protein
MAIIQFPFGPGYIHSRDRDDFVSGRVADGRADEEP